MRRIATRDLALALPLALGLACGEPDGATGGEIGARDPATEGDGPPSARPRVLTTFYPTTWLAERIGGDLVDVVCPLPAGADPVFWRPERETIRAYQEADLVLLNGAGLERWARTATLPASRTVDTAASFESDWIVLEGTITHSHGPEGEHSHEGLDGHTWLDPALARAQAEAIRDALARLVPEREAEIDARFEELAADLDALGRSFAELGAVPEGESLYASHPAYHYLAARHGWPIVSLDLDPEEMPAPETLAAIAERLAASPGRHLLWESEPAPEIADRIEAELGLASLLVSPCETEPEEGDYLDVMRANVDRLAPAFRPAAPRAGDPGPEGAGGG